MEPTRVLVIDDDGDVRESIQWLLEAEGYVVSLAANGREGLSLQRREPAHIVLTDIFMPEQDGIETLWQLREEFPGVPIIVMSGREADYSVVMRELGVKNTLRKPFDPHELIAIVRQITRSALS